MRTEGIENNCRSSAFLPHFEQSGGGLAGGERGRNLPEMPVIKTNGQRHWALEYVVYIFKYMCVYGVCIG